MEWFLTGFSARRRNLALHIMSGLEGCEDLLGPLRKHSRGTACMDVRRLDDLHLPTPKRLIWRSVRRQIETVA
jgi:hypothetical protein